MGLLANDLVAVRLRSAGWTPADGGWWSSAAFAQALRTDPQRRARVTAIDRRAAEAAYRRLAGAALPNEDTLRGYFSDDTVLASGAPLRLGTGADVHRVLFAGAPHDDDMARPRAHLQLADVSDRARPGLVGTGRLRADDTNLRWDLRRVGGAAWCIDITSDPAGSDAARWMLRGLTAVARRYGLIPAMIYRLA
jgi:hypothetical protein